MKKIYSAIFAFLFVLSVFQFAFAQIYETAPLHGNEKGFGIDLSMSGLGLGGFYRKAVSGFMHIGFSADFFIMKDDKEFSFYDPYVGYIKINNVNRLFLIPVNMELKKRFFANDIEDSFRPFGVAKIGVIFGMNFPDKEAARFYGANADNQYEISYNAVVGVGTDFGGKGKYFVSVRPQYRFVYFSNTIAGKKNHSSFEIKIEIGSRVIKE